MNPPSKKKSNVGEPKELIWDFFLCTCFSCRYDLGIDARKPGTKVIYKSYSCSIEPEISTAYKHLNVDKQRSFLLFVSQMLYLSCLQIINIYEQDKFGAKLS